MAGLPDGTYLILNGAQHGYAGFGLGADPNYNAVLYNPTKPVNQRMSVMANTTIAVSYFPYFWDQFRDISRRKYFPHRISFTISESGLIFPSVSTTPKPSSS